MSIRERTADQRWTDCAGLDDRLRGEPEAIQADLQLRPGDSQRPGSQLFAACGVRSTRRMRIRAGLWALFAGCAPRIREGCGLPTCGDVKVLGEQVPEKGMFPSNNHATDLDVIAASG